MKEVRRERKKEREGEVYNWCTERDVFMLHGFKGLNRKVIPTISDQNSCSMGCYSMLCFMRI